MFDLREKLLFELSRRLIKPPETKVADASAYSDWRSDATAHTWKRFDDALITNKDVIDFGSGQGNLTYYLAQKGPRRIVGVDIHAPSIAASAERAKTIPFPPSTKVEFVVGSMEGMPLPDASFDTLVAFDCMEHLMAPEAVLKDWARVLRPGGRAVIEWIPFRSPWGPHMESLVPIPWAHVLFGERAMFRTAERIYDLPDFVPRAWDLDEKGQRRPNKWKAWSSFQEQGYVNGLVVGDFKRMAADAGFDFGRFETHGFSSAPSKKLLSDVLLKIPGLGEYFTSFVLVELTRR